MNTHVQQGVNVLLSFKSTKLSHLPDGNTLLTHGFWGEGNHWGLGIYLQGGAHSVAL